MWGDPQEPQEPKPGSRASAGGGHKAGGTTAESVSCPLPLGTAQVLECSP
jgi:hypothetical protein